MALPTPEPGLVIGYAYLWQAEHERGREEGAKDRPCAVVLATADRDGDLVVTVVPVTHSRLRDLDAAVELPAATKQRLGLDPARSWVVVSEVNRFGWPGPDLRPIARGQPDRFDYGALPPALFRQIRERLTLYARARRLRAVKRSE